MEPATLPTNICFILRAVRTLRNYGRHLIETARQRATAANFNAIAVRFGTANLTTIMAHLNRGMLRVVALERFLLARAATGRDIDDVEPATQTPPPQLQPAAARFEAQRPASHQPSPRPYRPADRNDADCVMPNDEDIDYQVRNLPIGQTIVDICLDLAVVPGFCTTEFWNQLVVIMQRFGGDAGTLIGEKCCREHAFADEQNHIRDSNWDWLRLTRDGIRQVLGFFIGETPVNPFAQTAIATGPP